MGYGFPLSESQAITAMLSILILLSKYIGHTSRSIFNTTTDFVHFVGYGYQLFICSPPAPYKVFTHKVVL
jgi:hypothetical protein